MERPKRKRMTKEDREAKEKSRKENLIASWIPRTQIGKKVKSGEIKDIDEILDSGKKILEAEIIDVLFPNLEYKLITVGQSKGKFGGGKRSIWKQTQKKTKEGNKPKFSTVAVVGNGDGYVGIGHGKSKETVPAREKAIRKAKLNIMKIRRGCGSWEGVPDTNSIPFEVEGKCSSIRIRLIPAPKGTGLIIHKELQKILAFAGIKDVYSKSKGQTKTQLNLIKACMDALKKLNLFKVNEDSIKIVGLIEGKK